MGLPSKVVGGYWTYWRAPRLRDVPAAYNTVYLFSARPTGGQPGTDGSVFFEQSNQTHAELVADIAHLRSQGRAVILSIGGAGEALDITTNARREAFLASIHRIHRSLGGFDGIDWNIEEERLIQANIPNAVWVSQQLKATYGPRFAITTPPAPWRQADINFVTALNNGRALDLVAPQYYDHSSLTDATYVVDN
ncbi:glycosyl hydrolase family 18 protein, partial [Egicoccus sp. AB-alg6-2]|uniref:glycosyl hydrolase family 18 protein n=1 Tax=Egicoccus sp. AB-alg6-2 TaxID=3242692 RepID=UPI00359DF2AB